MRRRLLVLTMVVVLVCALVGGATFAYFSDSVTNTGNEFIAGTFELSADRDRGDGPGGPMFYTTPEEGQPDPAQFATGYWAPGDEYEGVLQVENIGTLDGYLKSISVTIDQGDSSLADKLWVRVTDDYDNDYVTSCTLAEFVAGPQPFNEPLEILSGDMPNIRFKVSWPSSEDDNDYMGKTIKATFRVYGEQM